MQVFEPDDQIGQMFHAYSLDCIDMAKANFDIGLSVTKESVRQIELMAGLLHDDLQTEEVPDKVIVQFQKYLGSHVAQVLIAAHGWEAGKAHFSEGQITAVRSEHGSVCWPWGKARNRLLNGPEDNLWHYYLHLTKQLVGMEWTSER